MWLRWQKESVEDRIAKAVREIVMAALGNAETTLAQVKKATELTTQIHTLREEIETLKIEKARKEEGHQRAQREIEHKVGLERKRQEQELALAKREAIVGVKEENLKADMERFEAQMKFHETRFTEEVGYLKTIIGDLAQRLPSASMKITQKAE